MAGRLTCYACSVAPYYSQSCKTDCFQCDECSQWTHHVYAWICLKNSWQDCPVPPRTSIHVSYLCSPRMELMIANERALKR